MKKIVCGAVVVCVFFGMGDLARAKSEGNATPAAQIEEPEGESDSYLGPVYFPRFYGSKGESKCVDNLEEWSKKKMSKYLDENGFLKSQGGFLPSKNCKFACKQNASGSCGTKVACAASLARGIDVESGLDLADDDGDMDTSEERPGKVTVTNRDGEEDDYYDLKDLSGEVTVDSEFKKSTKVLFVWQVRVEGHVPLDCNHKSGVKIKGIAIWPELCHPWHGTSWQDYEGGQVKTQLYIKTEDGDYSAVGDPVELTVPPVGKSKIKVVTVSDPTIFGSHIVVPDDFGGELPSTIEYKLKWANATPLRIKSLKGQRRMTIKVMPLTEEK